MVTFNIIRSNGNKEVYSYGLGQILRENYLDKEELFSSLKDFENYVNDLQKLIKYFKNHEESIKKREN